MIKLTSQKNKFIGVLGLGRSGISAVRALKAGGCNVFAWDDHEEKRNEAERGGIELTNLYQADFSKIELIVLSPGVPDLYPEPHQLIVKAREAGCEIICDIDLLARQNSIARFIGITGTNGKSTTTALLGHVLERASYSVELGGNFGIPALDLSLLDENGTYLIEMSSYQLERVPSVKFDIGILLNISADHLERHGGMQGYIAAKKLIFDRSLDGAVSIIGMQDSHCRNICLELMLANNSLTIVPISGISRVPGGIYVEHGILIDDINNTRKEIMDLRTNTALPGEHNWQNVAATFAASKSMGIKENCFVESVQSYAGLPHRQEIIREIDGVTFINDSKATNTASAAKALSCYSNIHWILGGQFKEKDLGILESVQDRVAHAYLIGDSANQLADLLVSFTEVSKCETLEAAVHIAHLNAAANKPCTILLSPACASFDQFENYEARGDLFRTLVCNIG